MLKPDSYEYSISISRDIPQLSEQGWPSQEVSRMLHPGPLFAFAPSSSDYSCREARPWSYWQELPSVWLAISAAPITQVRIYSSRDTMSLRGQTCEGQIQERAPFSPIPKSISTEKTWMGDQTQQRATFFPIPEFIRKTPPVFRSPLPNHLCLNVWMLDNSDLRSPVCALLFMQWVNTLINADYIGSTLGTCPSAKKTRVIVCVIHII